MLIQYKVGCQTKLYFRFFIAIPSMYPRPMSISVIAVTKDILSGKIFIRMLRTEETQAALATPSKNLSGKSDQSEKLNATFPKFTGCKKMPMDSFRGP